MCIMQAEEMARKASLEDIEHLWRRNALRLHKCFIAQPTSKMFMPSIVLK